MPSIRITIDHHTLQSLNRVAPISGHQRAAFLREAIKTAIRKHEYNQIAEAYARQPDSAQDADDWSSAEEWQN